jgi:sigma-B regulation protein RsbU (phosphoserine phosphatase)
VSFDFKSVWKRFGWLEKALGLVLLLYLILLVVSPEGVLVGLAGFAAFVLGGWLLLRLARVGLRKVIWRLRNRLIVAYLLIAVIPIFLILTLAALGAYMLADQVAVYLVRAELDRRIEAMRGATGLLMHVAPESRAARLQSTGEIYRERFPGIAFLIADGDSRQRWPAGAAIDLPMTERGNASGIVWRDGRYYAWSLAVQDDTRVLAMAPLSRRDLSALVPGLGDVYFVQISTDARQTAKSGMQIQPAERETATPALPPAVSAFDLDVFWPSLVIVADWLNPAKQRPAFLLVHTRLSAVLTVILSQKADEFQGLLPILLLAIAVMFLVVGIIGLLIGFSLSRTITGAVHSLYEGTQRVMQGDFSHLIKVEGRDQLAELSQSFNSMTKNLERLLAVAKEKERLETEIEIAREVQEQLYPKTAPVLKSLQVLGACHPARMVSGDYYDYQLVDGKLAIAIGDVAGKGISAALLMASIQAAMRMELRASVELAAPSANGLRYSTARMVSELNQQLHATTSPEKYATFFFALYDEETCVVTYTTAGHPPPILFRNGSASALDINGTVVGAFPFARYEESKIALQTGDLLICYTDGITEPENEYGEMFGEERLIELVSKNADRSDASIIETVMEAVRQWTGAPELSDDMTVVIARKH